MYVFGKYTLEALMHALGMLPLALHRFNARLIAFLVEKVIRYRVGLVDENLRYAFPEKTEKERLAIRHEFYIHFANIFVEAIWFGALCGSRRLRRSRIVEVVNPEVLNKFYKDRSVVIMSSHSGNWELSGGIMSYPYKEPFVFTEKDYCVVYHRLHSKLWDAVMADNRKAPLDDPEGFPGYLETMAVIRYVYKHKDERRLYNFITDQRPYFNLEHSRHIPFMNRDCMIMDGSASVAHKFSFAVVYQSMRVREGGYDIEYIPICEDASKMSVDAIMDRYFELLEDDLRKQPFNYLWTHNRWWQG